MEHAGPYEPLPSMPEELPDLHSAPPPPDLLASEEAYDWGAVPNLDQFFTRIYRYWEQKGFVVMLLSRVLNLAALGFTVLMSALLLLVVNWGALQADCLRRDTCDIMEVAFRRHPLEGGLTLGRALACLYLAAFSGYWLVALVHLIAEVRGLAEVRHFCNHKLGLSERQMATITWPEVAHRLVQVQSSTRLCIARDLTEHDVASRIMRKENYLIALLNKGVLALNVPIPGLRHHFLLTKTVEWNLYWCVLDALFDDHFRVRRAFLYNEPALHRRFRVLAALNLLASPFMLLFLLIYFFMKNAERFYHHPSSLGTRRWSPLAKWRLREFNELPHFISHRLNASHTAAEKYIQQFPNHALSHMARFVAFVSGSFAALLLALALVDERLLERDLLGRQIVWWVATVGMVLALSRAFIIESGAAFDPEAALMGVVAHTHYLPQHWRGRAHTREVQEQFESLFQYKAALFLEEIASTLLTPFVLYFSLPKCAGAILRFVEEHTTHIEGVGDVCSLAAFDFARHGNAKYGAPAEAPKAARSRQGKMEKSFLSFAAAYPQWEPPQGAPRRFLDTVAAQALNPRGAALAASVLAQGGFPIAQQEAPLLMASQLQQRQQASYHHHYYQQQQQQQQQQQGWLGRLQSPPKASSGIFASAELADAGGAAGAAWGAPGRVGPHHAQHAQHAQHMHHSQQQQQHGLAGSPMGPLLGGAAGCDAAERVAFSQMLLQSIYEEKEEEQLQQGQGARQLAVAAGARAPALHQPPSTPSSQPLYSPFQHPQQQRQQQQQQQQQHPQQQQQPQQPQQQALPRPIQMRQAARRATFPDGSEPRQTWSRPVPAPSRSRQLSSELSVLGREPSAALGTPRQWEAPGPWQQQQQQQQQQRGLSSGPLDPPPSDPAAQLHAAAARGDSAALEAALLAGARPNSRDADGLSPLHVVASRGHAGALLALLRAGAHPQPSDGHGRTPLHWAAFEGRTEAIQALLQAGADPGAADAHGSTPLHFAASSGHAAAAEALARAGADVSAVDNEGLTPLHRAMETGQLLVARTLVALGADPCSVDGLGRSPVDLAAAQGHSLLVEALRPPGSLEPAGAAVQQGQRSGFVSQQHAVHDVHAGLGREGEGSEEEGEEGLDERDEGNGGLDAMGDPLLHPRALLSDRGAAANGHHGLSAAQQQQQPQARHRHTWHPGSADSLSGSGSGHSGGSGMHHGSRGSPNLPDFLL